MDQNGAGYTVGICMKEICFSVSWLGISEVRQDPVILTIWNELRMRRKVVLNWVFWMSSKMSISSLVRQKRKYTVSLFLKTFCMEKIPRWDKHQGEVFPCQKTTPMALCSWFACSGTQAEASSKPALDSQVKQTVPAVILFPYFTS